MDLNFLTNMRLRLVALGAACAACLIGAAAMIGFGANTYTEMRTVLDKEASLALELNQIQDFKVEDKALVEKDYLKIANSLANQYQGLEIRVIKNKLILSTKSIEDFEVFRQAIYTTINSMANTKWKFEAYCLGEKECKGVGLSAELSAVKAEFNR